jgi:hypothetical protein
LFPVPGIPLELEQGGFDFNFGNYGDCDNFGNFDLKPKVLQGPMGQPAAASGLRLPLLPD